MRFAALVSILLLSCLNFEFESEYEDINGIYLKQIAAYAVYGEKIIVNNDLAYIIHGDTLLVYDVEEKDSVFLVNTYSASNSIIDFEVRGDYAYLAGGFGLEIVNISDSSPNKVGSLYIPDAWQVRVTDDHAYLVTGPYIQRFDIIDITNKSSPYFVDSISFGNVIDQIEVDSAFAYILLESNDFHVLNVSQPDSVFSVCSLPSADTVGIASFAVDGTYLHFSAYNDVNNLITYRLSNNAMDQTSEIECPIWFGHLMVEGDYGLGHLWGWIFLLGTTDHARPYITEHFYLSHVAVSADFSGNYIYLLPLRIIEIKHVAQ